MFRYLALVWRAHDQQQDQAAASIAHRLRSTIRPSTQVVQCPGLRVFCMDAAADAAHVLGNEHGVVLGTLFERNGDAEDDTPSRPATLNDERTRAIVASGGRWMMSRCWGNYVAFVRSANATWIVKDPTGSLPCFSTSVRDVRVFFSCIDDPVRVGIVAPTINQTFLRMRVAGAGMTLEQDALNEVSQVSRGECLELDMTRSPVRELRHQYWSPLNFDGSQDLIEDPERAARAMRATVRACTHSLSSRHESLLHRLSGGLDSSIVLGCLKDAPTRPRLTCYTYYNPKGRSDERPWAQSAARSAGCTHVERPVTPPDIDLTACKRIGASVEPTPMLSFWQRHSVERDIAAESRATAVFNGDGGDSGFCSDSIIYAVHDYVRLRGLSLEAVRLASQVALHTDRSLLAIAVHALREWLGGSSGLSGYRAAIEATSRLVSREVREEARADQTSRHPWFHRIGRPPASMIRRVGALLCTPDYYDGLPPDDAAPEVVAPLYSQPAIELFFRIPLHRHFEGRDRGLARRAFSGDVPEGILRRVWKDRAPGFHAELLRLQRTFLRELFLDGVLVRERLLDRAAVEAAFSSSMSAVLPGEIFKHLDIEIWARRWMGAGVEYPALTLTADVPGTLSSA